jgi:protein-L-isoaspartate(D-aspartate) O-methyltransferase
VKPVLDYSIRRFVDALRTKGIQNERVLAALAAVPRVAFVEPGFAHRAYEDEALPISLGQTISQPFTVATMTELLDPQPGDKILEVGTGSGYQAAVLCELGARVFSVERHEPLLLRTREVLERTGYRVRTRFGDGTRGWPAYQPYDGILVTAGGPEIPLELVEQLRPATPGRRAAQMLIPVGPPEAQVLHRVTRDVSGVMHAEPLHAVLFVPLVRDE